MQDLETEIVNLTIDLLNNSCIECSDNSSSQKDHACLSDFYYNLSLQEAISFIRYKYNIQEDLRYLYDKLSIK